jgi:hypothetical protein
MRHCHVILRHLEPGTSPLLTGLAMLADAREIRFTQELRPVPPPLPSGPWHLRDKAESGVDVVLDGRHTAYVDVHDSWEIDEGQYAAHHLYFKRSYDPARFPPGDHPRLRPFGLVSDLRKDGFDRWEAERILRQVAPSAKRTREFVRFLLSSAAALVDRGPRPTLSLLHAPPNSRLSPRILFMAGLWDPDRVPADSPEKAAEFHAINEMRAGCVRRLRAEFGDRFFGGMQHTEFARSRYPDVLLPDARAGSKRAYIERVRDFPICIATMGLHGSNGWKLAEYVGLSRAILSEPLRYQVPGGFGPPRNYLEFDSPDSCVERASALMSDAAARAAQMHANHEYYERWMRPDAFARRVLQEMAECSP